MASCHCHSSLTAVSYAITRCIGHVLFSTRVGSMTRQVVCLRNARVKYVVHRYLVSFVVILCIHVAIAAFLFFRRVLH